MIRMTNSGFYLFLSLLELAGVGVAWNHAVPLKRRPLLITRYPQPRFAGNCLHLLAPMEHSRKHGLFIRSNLVQTNLFMNNATTTSSSSSAQLCTSTALQLAATESSEEEPKTNDKDVRWLSRVKGYFLQEKEGDSLTFRQRLAKMGVATVLSYGMISNLSYAILVALAWYGSSVKTGLSPLAPGQWKGFLGFYSGFWIFNNVIRPLRLGLSIAIAPTLDNLVSFFQNRLKVSKPIAITVTVVVVNVIGTTVLMCGGIAIASLLAGVPIFPPK